MNSPVAPQRPVMTSYRDIVALITRLRHLSPTRLAHLFDMIRYLESIEEPAWVPQGGLSADPALVLGEFLPSTESIPGSQLLGQCSENMAEHTRYETIYRMD